MRVNTDKFNAIIEERGIKLCYIARKTRLTCMTITRLKQGEGVRPITVCKVADVLGISASELLD